MGCFFNRGVHLVVTSALLLSFTFYSHAQTVSVRVAATSDDAEENFTTGGAMEALDSSDLELGSEGPPNDAEGPQLIGMRFLDVNIPKGATINSATVQFQVDEDDKSGTPASFSIFGELSPDAATFTTAAENISSRPRTTNTVTWPDVPSWTGQVGSAGPDQLTPDLSSILQEIVNQDAWAANNSLVLMIEPLTPDNYDANRTAESFDGDPAGAPLLSVDFVPEPSGIILASLALLPVFAAGRRRRTSS